jgi:hypothetical protein
MLVARSYWDLQTYGTTPAGVVIVNDGDGPLTRHLVVSGGAEHDYPLGFHVEDGEQTRDYTFERPGTMTLELAPVPARSERLFIIWSDGEAKRGRPVGVKLAPSFGDALEKIQRRGDPEGRRRLARAIASGKTGSRRLTDGIRVAGAYWDHWTRGDQPAALVVRNDSERPRAAQIAVQSRRRGDFPARFSIEDGIATREYVFARAGRLIVDLSPVPPDSEQLFVIRSDRAWHPGKGDRRALGVKLLPTSEY